MWTRFNFFVTIKSALMGSPFLLACNEPSRELAISWRSNNFTINHLLAFYPLAAFGLWLIMFVTSKPLL
jgi:hypothetical protein